MILAQKASLISKAKEDKKSMEGKTLCVEIKDDMFYINDPLRYKKFECELELLYKEYYIGARKGFFQRVPRR